VWGSYAVPIAERLGGLDVSLLFDAASGVPLGQNSETPNSPGLAVGQINPIPYVTNPGYANPLSGSTVDYFFFPRDQYRTAAQYRTDFSTNYKYRFAGHLEALIRDRAEHAVRLANAAAPAAADAPARAAAPATASGAAPAVVTTVPGTQPADRLIVGMARRIQDGDVVVTGLASALPMLAVAVARATHAPRLTYINCVGAVDPEVTTALPTSVDPRLLETAAARLVVSDFFDMARRGRIDVMFFGAAQVDAGSRMNLSCIGDPLRPKVKLPGPAGSTSIRPFVRKVVVLVPRHAPRVLVERVDFASSVPSDRNRETWVVSDLALLRLEAGRLKVDSRHAGTDAGTLRSRTGFALPDADAAKVTAEPTDAEKDAIERLDPHGLRHRLAG